MEVTLTALDSVQAMVRWYICHVIACHVYYKYSDLACCDASLAPFRFTQNSFEQLPSLLADFWSVYFNLQVMNIFGKYFYVINDWRYLNDEWLGSFLVTCTVYSIML